jgi:hypothetical protein
MDVTTNNLKEPDYEKLMIEITGLISIGVSPTPSFSGIAEQVAEVQAAKSRICAILLKALSNLRGYEKLWNDVRDVELVMRQEKSAEQRESAVRAKYSIFWNAYQNAEVHKDQAQAAYQELIGISRDLETQLRAMTEEARLEGRTVQGPIPRSGSTNATWENLNG